MELYVKGLSFQREESPNSESFRPLYSQGGRRLAQNPIFVNLKQKLENYYKTKSQTSFEPNDSVHTSLHSFLAQVVQTKDQGIQQKLLAKIDKWYIKRTESLNQGINQTFPDLSKISDKLIKKLSPKKKVINKPKTAMAYVRSSPKRMLSTYQGSSELTEDLQVKKIFSKASESYEASLKNNLLDSGKMTFSTKLQARSSLSGGYKKNLKNITMKNSTPFPYRKNYKFKRPLKTLKPESLKAALRITPQIPRKSI